MSNIPIASLQTVAAAGVLTPSTGVSISPITGEVLVRIRIQNLSAIGGPPPAAAIVLQDSVDGFATFVNVAEKIISGPVSREAEAHLTWAKNSLSNARWNVPSASLRVNVVRLTGNAVSLTVDAWLET